MNEIENEDVPVRRRRALAKPLAAVLLLLAAAVGGYAYWNRLAGRESTDDAQIDGRIHTISARVGGTVAHVRVRDNQYVEAGTVLVEIDPRDYEVALARAKADLAEAEADSEADRAEVPVVSTTTSSRLTGAEAGIGEARAALSASEKQVEAARARLGSAEAIVRQAKANADKAARDLERYKTLLDKDEIARQQYDAAAAAAEATRAQYEAALEGVREAQQGVRAADSQSEQQRARLIRAESDARSATSGPQQVAATRARAGSSAAKVLQMRAALAQAELNLGYTTVRAPVSGVVGQKNVEVGVTVQAGQPLLAVVPLDDIWVTAQFKENQLAKMRPGQRARVEVDAYGGRAYEARVESIAAATGARFSLLPPENSSGNYVKVVQRVPVKIVFEKGQDSEHLLRPGMSVVPTVELR